MNDNKFEIIGSTLLVRMGYFILEVMNQNRPRVYIAVQHTRNYWTMSIGSFVNINTTSALSESFGDRDSSPRSHQNCVSPWYKNNVLLLTSAIFIRSTSYFGSAQRTSALLSNLPEAAKERRPIKCTQDVT